VAFMRGKTSRYFRIGLGHMRTVCLVECGLYSRGKVMESIDRIGGRDAGHCWPGQGHDHSETARGKVIGQGSVRGSSGGRARLSAGVVIALVVYLWGSAGEFWPAAGQRSLAWGPAVNSVTCGAR